MINIQLVFSIFIGYLIGSIPWAYIITKRFKNIDITKKGSGNLGSTNVYRTSGIKIALVVYILDMLKGLLPILIGNYYNMTDVGVLASLAAVIGHCYSPFMNFKGGKGVAVSSGLILGINVYMFIILVIIQFGILFITKIMSVASISSAILFPVFTYYLYGSSVKFYVALFVGIFVIYKHRENIKRLIKGEEKKLI